MFQFRLIQDQFIPEVHIFHVFGCQKLFARPSFITGDNFFSFESLFLVIKWMNLNLAHLLTYLPTS
jgi:hypothetical protein